jgi:hypothetical protein
VSDNLVRGLEFGIQLRVAERRQDNGLHVPPRLYFFDLFFFLASHPNIKNNLGGRGERGGGRGAGRGGRGARACVRACTRRLACPLLPNANPGTGRFIGIPDGLCPERSSGREKPVPVLVASWVATTSRLLLSRLSPFGTTESPLGS